MCRLLGYATRTPTTLAQLLGPDDLACFTELARKHGDGWGVARATDGRVVVDKGPDSALTSPGFASAAADEDADLAMVHLRWATLGLPVATRNAHPFTDGRAAFAHNGSIKPPRGVDALVPAHVRPLLAGDTDSERFFLAVLGRLPADLSDATAVAAAYAETARAITAAAHRAGPEQGGLEASSLNSMLVTPTHLYALCCYASDAELREDEPEYYRLRYRRTDDAVVVSSSGWGSGWSDLTNGQLLVVERGSLAARVVHVDAAAEAA